jgi:hypothetical protein
MIAFLQFQYVYSHLILNTYIIYVINELHMYVLMYLFILLNDIYLWKFLFYTYVIYFNVY